MSTREGQVTRIDLLRHGKCQGGEIYRGRTDVALHKEGWAQMHAAVTVPRRWQRVVSSPLKRCREFAAQCADKLQLPLQVEPGFKEMDFGEWEGQLLQDVWRADPDFVSSYYSDPGAVTPPGGEPAVAAQARAVQCWGRLVDEFAGEHILVVSHGGIIRLLVSHLLNLPLSSIARLHVPYASLTQVQVHHRDGGDFPVLMSLNGGSES